MQRIELIRKDRSPNSYQKYRPGGYQQHREEAVSNNIRKGIFQNNASNNTIEGLQSYGAPKYTALNSQIANNLYKNHNRENQGKYVLRDKSNYSSLAINSYNNRNYSRNY